MNLDKLNNLKPTPKITALLNKRMWMRFILNGIIVNCFEPKCVVIRSDPSVPKITT